jgi:hypothetical protein
MLLTSDPVIALHKTISRSLRLSFLRDPPRPGVSFLILSIFIEILSYLFISYTLITNFKPIRIL